MRASDVLKGTVYEIIAGDPDCRITDLADDSRDVTPGAMFVCRRGARTDGHGFIDDAVARGAACIVITDDTGISEKLPDGHRNGAGELLVVRLYDYRYGIGTICNNFWNSPSKCMMVIGVTGTKGKTTVSCMIKSMLDRWGRRTGLVGTIEIDDCIQRIPSMNTTPGVIYLHRKLADMVANGAEYCVMEVSSQGLMHGRVSGVEFDICVYTNLSPDHIGQNEHRTFAEYGRWKRSLFSRCKTAVINADDVYSGCIAAEAVNVGAEVVYYGVRNDPQSVSGDDNVCMAGAIHRLILHRVMGIGYEYERTDGESTYMTVGIPGEFNVYNSLAAVTTCGIIGIPMEIMQDALSDMKVKGRLEPVEIPGYARIFIDYAHNAVSLENVLTTLRQYRPKRLICLFGCGGNRSSGRRKGMGFVSGRLADMTVITSDNPRYESPDAIMADIETGVLEGGGKYVKICSRLDAIRYALETSDRDDIVLLAGKGHETYQDIEGHRTHMDEREMIRQILEEKDAGIVRRCDN